MRIKLRNHKGLSIVEVLIALSIISVIIAAAVVTQVTSFSVTKRAKDKAFAGQKAMQMMEELRSFVQGGENNFFTLENKDDKGIFNPILTTEILPTQDGTEDLRAASPTSGNYKYKGRWRFLRLVQVRRLPTDMRAREVSIKVFYSVLGTDGQVIGIAPPVSQLTSILRTTASPNIPMQVIDTYALTLDNVSAWWSDLSTLKPVYTNVVGDLGTRNAGLDFKSHFITRLSYGRDPYYSPYITQGKTSAGDSVVTESDANLKYAYFYPGKIKNKSASNAIEESYSYSSMNSDGARLLIYDMDNSKYSLVNWWEKSNGEANTRVYSLADQYNNATRYADEYSIHNRFKLLAKSRNELLEPTYRLFVEDLNTSDSYKNVIVTNLHGELFPFPPIRNYSDPAKDPIASPSVRVVTHPENIGFTSSGPNAFPPINFRVYSYLRDTSASATSVPTTTLFIPTHRRVGSDTSITDLGLSNFVLDKDQLANILSKITITRITGDSSNEYKETSTKYGTIITKPGNKGAGQVKFSRNNINTAVSFAANAIVSRPTSSLTYKLNSAATIASGSMSVTGIAVTATAKGTTYNVNTTSTDAISITPSNTNCTPTSTSCFAVQTANITDGSTSKAATTGKISIFRTNTSITIPAGTIVQTSGGIQFVTQSDVTMSPSDSSVLADVISVGEGATTNVAASTITVLGSTFTNSNLVSVTNTSAMTGGIDAIGTTVLPIDSSKYDITLNPNFDYNGDGLREEVPGILITLKDTPTRTDPYSSGTNLTGIADTKKLYGMQYIPTPLDTASFPKDRNLYAKGDKVKNTARWIISLDINAPSADTVCSNPDKQSDLSCFQGDLMRIETRIGNDLNTGLRMDGTINSSLGTTGTLNSTVGANSRSDELLSDLSRTYTWIGITVPATERYQVIGDPRHNPYLDVITSRGYNWFFGGNSTDTSKASNVNSATDYYPTITGLLSSSFSGNNPDADIPRIFQLFRQGLLYSNAIYTSMTGFTDYYYGIGGELGLDTNNRQNFDVKGDPYNSSSLQNIQSGSNEITSNQRIIGSDDNKWVALPWLGELYPDSEFSANWSKYGNLSTSTYKRDIYTSSFTSIGSVPISSNNKQKRLSEWGCATFFNGNSEDAYTTSKFFNHNSTDGTYSYLTAKTPPDIGIGEDLAQSYNLPLLTSIVTARPFTLSATNNGVASWGQTYSQLFYDIITKLSFLPTNGANPNRTVSEDTVFYKHTSGIAGSAIVRMEERYGDTSNNRAHIIVNGLAPQGQEATTYIAKYAIATMLYTFVKTGNSDNSDTTGNSTIQVPLVNISSSDSIPKGNSPKEGAEISSDSMEITWNTRWKRWDGLRYSKDYADTWQENSDVTIKYNLMYSGDRGRTWSYLQDDKPVTEVGEYDPSHGITGAGFTNGVESDSYTWDISGLNNNQTYTFRIEGYRFYNNIKIDLHYSYHQREFYIKRSS